MTSSPIQHASNAVLADFLKRDVANLRLNHLPHFLLQRHFGDDLLRSRSKQVEVSS